METYGFSPEYEQVIAVMCCTIPHFYGRVGHALVADLFRDEAVQLLVKASQAIGKDIGHGPSDHRTVMQRIAKWMDDGQVTEEMRLAALDVLIDAPTPPPVDEVVAEVVSVVKRRMQQDLVQVTIDEYGKKGDFDEVQKRLQQMRRFGQVDTSIGSVIGPESFERIKRLAAVDRLPTGIAEIDINLNGGLPRGAAGMYAGATGAGKSMWLDHQTAGAMRAGLFTAFATLELSKEQQEARILANLSGESIYAVEASDKVARQKIDQLYPVLGQCIVQDFPAGLTTIPEILDWVKRCEDVEGYPVDFVVIDYADKLKSHDRSDKSGYDAGKTITESFRLWLKDNKRWGWTASQPQRKAAKEKGRRIEADELADSQHKARIVDLLITGIEAEGQVTYFCPKYRLGRGGWTVGPLPHDWERGRMIVMEDDF